MSHPIETGSVCAEDRRTSNRFGCRLHGECQPVAPLETGNCWPARVTDISRGGMNLRLTRRFEPGTFLTLELTSFPAEGAYMPLARVCHVQADGLHWRLGCVWSRELAGEDLRALVGRCDKPRMAA